MNVHMVYWHDRHTDPDIALFDSQPKAFMYIHGIMAGYTGKWSYDWTSNEDLDEMSPEDQKEYDWITKGILKGYWDFYITSYQCDDGPWGYIKEMEVG